MAWRVRAQERPLKPSPARLSGQAVLASLDAGREALPVGRREDERRPIRVLGVTDGDDAGEVARYFDAVPAVAGAPGGLAPHKAAQVHVFAASSIRSRDAARGRASALIVSHRTRREPTSAALSTICP